MISVMCHGRSLALAVRTAPPGVLPLCCLSLRTGFGVEPTYKDFLFLARRRYTQ